MSLVNFSVQPDRILVAVDSIGGNSKFRMHVSKMFPIPHANMLVCGRGSMAFLARVTQVCGLLSGIDEARKFFPDELPKLLRYVRTEAILHAILSLGRFGGFDLSIFDAQEIYVFGWSDEDGEFTALQFQKHAGARRFTLEDDLAEGVAPKLEREFPPLDSPETMMRVAGEQVRNAMREGANIPIGGRLVVAELTRDACKVRCAGDINFDHMYMYRVPSK